MSDLITVHFLATAIIISNSTTKIHLDNISPCARRLHRYVSFLADIEKCPIYAKEDITGPRKKDDLMSPN